MKLDPPDVALIAWPLTIIDDPDGYEAVLGVDDKWRTIQRGQGSYKGRAVPLVFDTSDRMLVGLRPDPTSGEARLALPGDTELMRVSESVFVSAANALTELIGLPFGRGDATRIKETAAEVLRTPLMSATFDLDDAAETVVICLPLVLSEQEQVATVRASGDWIGQTLTWVECTRLLAALRGDVQVVQASFYGRPIATGFHSALVKPLLQQLVG